MIDEESKPEEQIVLFENPKAREKKYWEFIKMIAPSLPRRPIGGWTIHDYIGLYCTKCKLKLNYIMSDSKVIRRHMNRVHSEDLLKYDAEIKSKMSAEKRMMDNFVTHSYKKMKTAGSSEFEKVKDLCANWIAKHYRPMQIVEDKGFIELVEHCLESINGPTCTFRTPVVSETGTFVGNICYY